MKKSSNKNGCSCHPLPVKKLVKVLEKLSKNHEKRLKKAGLI